MVFENSAVTLTALAPPPSDTRAGSSDRWIDGVLSLSAKVMLAPPTVSSATAPLRDIVSSPSISLSPTGFSVKLPVPLD